MKLSYTLILAINLALFTASSVATPIGNIENGVINKRGNEDEPKIPPPPPGKFPDGPKGVDFDGLKGPKGKDFDGPKGSKGPKGKDFDGPKGSKGPKGKDFDGPKGSKGPK
ncbi:18229_t:CDS:1, partial [Rhizophagus irregularis]